MISLDQVLLLEQKVESAVEKIRQLQNENDALRKKCSELTNALSSKSEQLSNFETDQNKIELGIRKALDRLTSIENSVLKAAGSSIPSFDTMESVQKEPVKEEIQPVQTVQTTQTAQAVQTAQTVQAPLAKEEAVEAEIEQPVEEPINQDISISEAQSQQPPKIQVPFAEDIPDETIPTRTVINPIYTEEPQDGSADEIMEDSDDDESQDSLGFDIF